jgi:hypothetical protein
MVHLSVFSAEVVFAIPVLSFYPCWNLVRYSASVIGIYGALYVFGYSVVGSLAGVSYFGPVAGHGFISHDLEMVREERRKVMEATSGQESGPVVALPAGENSDHFVIIHKKDAQEQ